VRSIRNPYTCQPEPHEDECPLGETGYCRCVTFSQDGKELLAEQPAHFAWLMGPDPQRPDPRPGGALFRRQREQIAALRAALDELSAARTVGS